MSPQESTEVSEKTSQQWALSETSIQQFLDLEVDTVVLRKELTDLVGLCTRIVNSLRELRLSPQVQALQE